MMVISVNSIYGCAERPVCKAFEVYTADIHSQGSLPYLSVIKSYFKRQMGMCNCLLGGLRSEICSFQSMYAHTYV